MTRPPTALFLLLLLPLAAFCSLPPAPAPFPDFPHLQQRHTLKAATCHMEDDLRSLLTRGDASTPADGGLSGEELARRVQHDVMGRHRDMLLLITTVTGASFDHKQRNHTGQGEAAWSSSLLDFLLQEELVTLLLIVVARGAVVLLLLSPLLSLGRGEYRAMLKKAHHDGQQAAAHRSPGREEYRRASSHAAAGADPSKDKEEGEGEEGGPEEELVDDSRLGHTASSIHHPHHRHHAGSSMSSVSMPSSASSSSSSSTSSSPASSPVASPRQLVSKPSQSEHCLSEHELATAFAVMEHHHVDATDLLPFMMNIPKGSMSRQGSRIGSHDAASREASS